MTVLSANNIGKAFRTYSSEWHRFARWFGLPLKPAEEAWVLRNITFEIEPGEAIGIVGQNGAGKSTLLKIITGTLQPTEGQVHINGRIAAILELGMGFNPELSGRENVRHAAGLMGFSPDQIDAVMPEIEQFAEIGAYFDEPVRVYSSGMQVRVAFGVATAWRPEILIVDEALSVGDIAFQRKCFQRIESYRSAGTTLLFVSHDIETVKKLCDRALFIRDGRMAQLGPAKQVCDEYERYLFGDRKIASTAKQAAASALVAETAQFDPSFTASCAMSYGNGKATISNVRIEDTGGNRVNVAQTGMVLFFVFDVQVATNLIDRPCLNMQVKTTDGVVIYGVSTDHLNEYNLRFTPGDHYRVSFKLENRLAPGIYFLTCGFKEGGVSSDVFCSRVVDGVALKVVDRAVSTVARGIVDLRARFYISEVDLANI